MAIYLEQLPHQEEAISSVLAAMSGCREVSSEELAVSSTVFANPEIQLKKESLHNAVIDKTTLTTNDLSLPASIDVKMETGTGKTYVYTRLMYELYKNFGLNKFIIFVPSLPIKEGTKNFIAAHYARQHFSGLYENMKIDLDIINAGSFNTKKGRKTLPSELIDYLEGSRNQQNTIKCLLINDAMLMSKSMTRNDYDQTLFDGLSCPVEALKQTRPIIIIDEPHRFKKDGKAYQAIAALNPQVIIRFGATFPADKNGKKDYENLVYNLGSVQAFNDGLVKGIDIHYPNVDGSASNKYNVKSVNGKKLVLTKGTTEYELSIGDSLPDEFGSGITFEGANKENGNGFYLSNDYELKVGKDLPPPFVYTMGYQELLLGQAIDRHFAKEKENWLRENAGVNAPKIKTLSLFFIGSIKDYRENDGPLKVLFEELLRKKLKTLIDIEPDTKYKEFLQATLDNLSESHAGYFAQDNGKGDEALQAEVDDILRNKEEMLSFRRKDGSWNIRRFLFSKWTLREGWDNPNVFVITKLRTSGSDISKLQEVGRGLRLPVDENGKRLSAEEFRLDYIIDWSERNFAQTLVREINSDGGRVFEGKITNTMIEELKKVAYGKDLSTLKLKGKLNDDKIIDDNEIIIDAAKLTALLPDTLNAGKVRNNQSGTPKIAVDKTKWDNIKDLWQRVTKKYLLQFEKLDADELKSILEASAAADNFVGTSGNVIVKSLCHDTQGQVIIMEKTEYTDSNIGEIPYGEFLKRLSIRTSIKVQDWHKVFSIKFSGGLDKNKINVQSLENIIVAFQKEFVEKFAQKYSYQSLNFTANTSLLKGGNFVNEIAESDVGSKEASGVAVGQNYLWSKILVDSEIEKEIIQHSTSDKILVFGKIPRKAIRVPTYTGGTTTPDFVYAIKNDKDAVKVNLFVEAKSQNMRDSEKIAVRGQERFFEQMRNQNENVEWIMETYENISTLTAKLQELAG
jgi:type III restriction enzyme